MSEVPLHPKRGQVASCEKRHKGSASCPGCREQGPELPIGSEFPTLPSYPQAAHGSAAAATYGYTWATLS